MQTQNTPILSAATDQNVLISAKWYGGRWNRWKLSVTGTGIDITLQLYYKTVPPRDLGIYAGSSWSDPKTVSASYLLSKIEGRRGGLSDLRKSLEMMIKA